jgi:hypothetical protein
LAKPIEHGLRGVDAVDARAAFGERDGYSAGPDAEPECAPGADQFGQEVDGPGRARADCWIDVPVVDAGDAIAVGGRAVLGHARAMDSIASV